MTVSGVLVSSIVNTVAIVVLFTLIPLILYMGKQADQTVKGFLNSVGIYKCPRANLSDSILFLSGASVIAFGITTAVVLSGNRGRASGNTQDFSTITYCIFLIFHGLRTGIGEEIFFRGFVGKKLVVWLGFSRGNFLQALLFGLGHIPFIGTDATTAHLVGKVLGATLLGYAFGYVTERRCNGSILPAIVAHGLYNIVASVLLGVIYYIIS